MVVEELETALGMMIVALADGVDDQEVADLHKCSRIPLHNRVGDAQIEEIPQHQDHIQNRNQRNGEVQNTELWDTQEEAGRELVQCHNFRASSCHRKEDTKSTNFRMKREEAEAHRIPWLVHLGARVLNAESSGDGHRGQFGEAWRTLLVQRKLLRLLLIDSFQPF